MSHATYTQGCWGDSWLLMVGSQIANLILNPFFGHNLCLKCSNGSYEPILDIYVSRSFQLYKKLLNPLSFDPWNCSLKIWKSTGTPIPKVEAPLGMWRFIPSHFPTLLGAWGVTPGLPSWLVTLQALVLVASPRLGLQQRWSRLRWNGQLNYYLLDFYLFVSHDVKLGNNNKGTLVFLSLFILCLFPFIARFVMWYDTIYT
jgi:hypothetical protein